MDITFFLLLQIENHEIWWSIGYRDFILPILRFPGQIIGQKFLFTRYWRIPKLYTIVRPFLIWNRHKFFSFDPNWKPWKLAINWVKSFYPANFFGGSRPNEFAEKPFSEQKKSIRFSEFFHSPVSKKSICFWKSFFLWHFFFVKNIFFRYQKM